MDPDTIMHGPGRDEHVPRSTSREEARGRRELLLFKLAGQRFALYASSVIELARAVSIQRLPRAPAVVEGIIAFRGDVIPVLDVRARFRLPPKPLALSDQLIIARIHMRRVALRVDRCLEFIRLRVVPMEHLDNLPQQGIEHVAGVTTAEDGIVVIQDLEAFLTEAESCDLDQVLATAAGG